MKQVCIAIAACVALALGVIATAEGPDAKQAALNRGTPIAKEVLTPNSLSIQTSIDYSRAALKVSGPRGLHLMTSFDGDEGISLDLLKAEWTSPRNRRVKKEEPTTDGKKAPHKLTNGRYRYEIHFFKKGEKIQFFSGQFFVEDGAAVSRQTVRSRQKEAREGLAKPGREGTPAKPGEDLAKFVAPGYLYVPPTYLPNSWITMASYDFGYYAMEHFTFLNYSGDLQIGSRSYFYPPADPYFTPQVTIPRAYVSMYPPYGTYFGLGVGTTTPYGTLELNAPYFVSARWSSPGYGAEWQWEIYGGNFDIFESSTGAYPIVIEPNMTNSLFPLWIQDTGNVGMGTSMPAASLHVWRDDGTAQLSVEETSTTEATRTMFNLANNGVGYIRLTDTSPDGSGWTFQAEGPSFRFNKAGTGGAEIFVRGRNDAGGQPTLTVDGSVSADNVVFMSSRLAKTEFTAVDSLGVLEKVIALPISEWTFKDEQNGRRHIGPMAEEFADSFGFGGSNKNISLIDASGVTLAAIQGLYEVVQERQSTIDSLTAENQELQRRLERLEAVVGELMQAD
jgi:hypothetical protein